LRHRHAPVALRLDLPRTSRRKSAYFQAILGTFASAREV
jgi:hypothetical protein